MINFSLKSDINNFLKDFSLKFDENVIKDFIKMHDKDLDGALKYQE